MYFLLLQSISAELTKEAEQNLKKMIKTAVDKIRSLNGVVKENIRELSSDLLLSHELHIAVALASIRRSSDLILDGLDGATRAAVIGEIQHATYEPVKELLEVIHLYNLSLILLNYIFIYYRNPVVEANRTWEVWCVP